MNCPGCSGKGVVRKGTQIYDCKSCGGVFGDCYLGDSYGIVLPRFSADGQVADARAKYFDLTCLGSEGVTRRHGWFDPITKLITQVG